MSAIYKCILILVYILSLFSNLLSFDRSFFYRASSFWDEPRFEIGALTTLNTQFSGGTTRIGLNKCSKKTSLFGIYGPENLNINSLNIDKFTVTGAFDIFETNFNLYQNLCYGFYWHLHVPVVSVQIFPISCIELKKIDFLDEFCIDFQNKVLALDKILKENCKSLGSLAERGLSDTTLFFGWSLNYENTQYLDFLDFSVQLGPLFPTGKKINNKFIFDIPLGYNGHYGLAWSIDIAAGAYDWLSFGIHNDGVGFFDSTVCLPIRTIEDCTGFIRFKSGTAKVKSGPVWRIGAYIKADHVCWGFSLLTGFSFEQKNRNCITAVCPNFNLKIANNDERLRKWNRWIYHILVEYDFAKEDNICNPLISLLYNHQITGKRVFRTNILGGYIGFNIAWCF